MEKEDLFLKTISGQPGSGKNNAILGLMQVCKTQFGKKLLYVYNGLLYKKEDSDELLTYNMKDKTKEDFEKFLDENKESLVLVYLDESCSMEEDYATMLSMKGLGIVNASGQPNISDSKLNLN